MDKIDSGAAGLFERGQAAQPGGDGKGTDREYAVPGGEGDGVWVTLPIRKCK